MALVGCLPEAPWISPKWFGVYDLGQSISNRNLDHIVQGLQDFSNPRNHVRKFEPRNVALGIKTINDLMNKIFPLGFDERYHRECWFHLRHIGLDDADSELTDNHISCLENLGEVLKPFDPCVSSLNTLYITWDLCLKLKEGNSKDRRRAKKVETIFKLVCVHRYITQTNPSIEKVRWIHVYFTLGIDCVGIIGETVVGKWLEEVRKLMY